MPKRYTSNVTDSQWALVKEYFETDPAVGGRPRRHSARTLLDAIFYVMRTGCSWRDLPGDFPPWKTVWRARQRWHDRGVLQRAFEALARA